MTQQHDDDENLLTEYKKEKDSRKKERLCNMSNHNQQKINHACCRDDIQSIQYDKNGTNNFSRSAHRLEDKPRSGRPPKLFNVKITYFMDNDKDHTFPKEIIKEIKDSTGVTYSESWARQQLHEMSHSRKVPTTGTTTGNQSRM